MQKKSLKTYCSLILTGVCRVKNATITGPRPENDLRKTRGRRLLSRMSSAKIKYFVVDFSFLYRKILHNSNIFSTFAVAKVFTMESDSIKLFESKQIRTAWDEEQEKWYFSVVDVIGVLVDSVDYLTARKYWNKLKQRLTEEGNQTVTNCHQLKMTAADGKHRFDVLVPSCAAFRRAFQKILNHNCLNFLVI